MTEPAPAICANCNGTGNAPHPAGLQQGCPSCGGTGRMTEPRQIPADEVRVGDRIRVSSEGVVASKYDADVLYEHSSYTVQITTGRPVLARAQCWAPRLDGELLAEEYDPHSATEEHALGDGYEWEAESREDIDEDDDHHPRLVTAEQVGPCYELRCAVCGEALHDLDTGGWLHYDSPFSAEQYAADAYWRQFGGIWRCPRCCVAEARTGDTYVSHRHVLLPAPQPTAAPFADRRT